MGELYANKGPFGLAFKVDYMGVDSSQAVGVIAGSRVDWNLIKGMDDLYASWGVRGKVRLPTSVRTPIAGDVPLTKVITGTARRTFW